MIILEQLVSVKWQRGNKIHFTSLGYEFTFYGDTFTVKLNELKKQSTVLVKAQCDFCMQAILRKYGLLNASIHHYCSKKCEINHRKEAAEKKKIIVNCRVCNKEIPITKSKVGKKKCCSKRCANKYQSSKEMQKIRAARSIEIKTECMVCGEPIGIPPHRFKGDKKHSCSNECRAISYRRKKKLDEEILEDVVELFISKDCTYVDTPNLNKRKLINFLCNKHINEGVQNRTWQNIVNVVSPCKYCIKEERMAALKMLNKVDVYLEVLNGDRRSFPDNFVINLTDNELRDILQYYRSLCEKDGVFELDMIKTSVMKNYKIASFVQYLSKIKISELLYDGKYMPWEINICPPSYWENTGNIHLARNWLVNKLIQENEISSIDDIVNLKSHRYFKKYGLDGLLYSKYSATVFYFWNEYFNGRYKEWEYAQTKRNYWTSSENRREALKYLIEEKLKIKKDEIPGKFTYGLLVKEYHKFSLICDSYYNSDLFKWIDEVYPLEFTREQFTDLIANDGTIVDSRIERDIHNLLLKNNVNAMYIQNKQDVENSFINDDYGERYVPDWIIDDNIIVEYYGWFMKDYEKKGNDTTKIYNAKLRRKNEYYKLLDGYLLIDLYPSDIEKEYKGLLEKFKKLGIELSL